MGISAVRDRVKLPAFCRRESELKDDKRAEMKRNLSEPIYYGAFQESQTFPDNSEEGEDHATYEELKKSQFEDSGSQEPEEMQSR